MNDAAPLPDYLILFDGVCNFCNATINFTLRHDKRNLFYYAPLQSKLGQQLLEKYDLAGKGLDSFVLIEKGKAYVKTTAALRVARKLNGGWPLMYAFIIVPPFIRNVVYNIIAKNRYRWWGKRESCMVPTPDIRKKFLDWV